jgi:NADPH-dependent 2,4-dienoyl-CoA reductase/sulfur reductase-like enzyme/predicted acylesterase/phospholipase RssA
MTNSIDFLLIGGGLASATAAETLRKEGAAGKIAMISAENTLPYHRPPLSKHFLLGKRKIERILVHQESYYREQKIDVILGTKALSIYPESKIVETDNAGEFHFKKLLIAAGASPIKLSVPGADLPGIYYLRTVPDARALMQAMAEAKRAVVVGGSFIGMELASSFTKRGIQVTIVTKEDILFDKLASPQVSEFFTEYCKARGVELILGETIKEFKGRGRVEGVVTCTGRIFPCDFVAIGVGVVPETKFLDGSGIIVSDGVLVDQYMQTNKLDIYAAGDIANFFDPIFGRHRRIEHWDNAIKQGQIAAKNMKGQRQAWRTVSYFFADIFDLTFDFLGDPTDTEERIIRGSIKEKSFSVLYLKDDVLRAMFFLRRPTTEAKAGGSLILNRVGLSQAKRKLSDATFPLEEMATQTVLILQGGGALGAFECGVVKAMEERGIHPDIVAGVSIGAFNSAIIAGNPRNAEATLDSFWKELALNTPEIPNEEIRRLLSSWCSLIFGPPRFFRPRWFVPALFPNQLPLNWTSFYDPSPVRGLLRKYVDFEKLKDSPIRLLVSAVNVETAELETFDSYRDKITPDHILASGSLPPAFPWMTIAGKHYWDGGIVSNTPLDQVMEICGSAGKKVYIVNLYPSKKPLPRNMIEVFARLNEISYSEKIRKDVHTRELIDRYRKLIEEIMAYLEPKVVEQIKQRPRYIETMGESYSISITRIVHEGEEGEPALKDYDFSRRSIDERKEQGYEIARKILEKEAAHEKPKIRA